MTMGVRSVLFSEPGRAESQGGRREEGWLADCSCVIDRGWRTGSKRQRRAVIDSNLFLESKL